MPGTEDERSRDFFNQPTRRVRAGAGADEPTAVEGRDGTSTKATEPGFAGRRSILGVEVGGFEETRTRRAGPSSPSAIERPGESSGGDPGFVVGWIVIVEGPGRGASRPLGYGMSAIGRGESASVRLDFGDDEISRTHCQIAYDHRNRKFFLQHGGGQNLTYLGDDPVLAATELTAGARITLGRTVLQFVPLCGPSFDWER